MGILWDSSPSLDTESFVEPNVGVHIWSSHLLHGKFPDFFFPFFSFFECLKGTLLEAHCPWVHL